MDHLSLLRRIGVLVSSHLISSHPALIFRALAKPSPAFFPGSIPKQASPHLFNVLNELSAPSEIASSRFAFAECRGSGWGGNIGDGRYTNI